MSKVVWNGDEDECWEWQASRGSHGYGQIAYKGKPRLAHRLSYELLAGPIPAGLDIDHLCRNRGCVNPGHLEPVTRSVNLRRGESGENVARIQRAKTHCPRGHPYSGANLIIRPEGWRACRTCVRERSRSRRAKEG